MRAVLIFPGSCIPSSPSRILYRVNAFNFSFDRSLMYSWYVFVIEIWKSSGKRNRTENFHSRELSRRIGLSCSQYEFPFRLDFTAEKLSAMENSSNDCYGMHNTRNSTRHTYIYIHTQHDTPRVSWRRVSPGIIYGSCEEARRCSKEEGDVESR